jgi:hypothetical protein
MDGKVIAIALTTSLLTTMAVVAILIHTRVAL